ncbi:hypothetical protein ACSAGD_00660 [Paramicrobacterium sp. CJ85]|uniref:hypothetical protein n=1 Tax=Paramicrobacterium sp. CJ85 TaxID=3445355 RepID=UPI003F641DCA
MVTSDSNDTSATAPASAALGDAEHGVEHGADVDPGITTDLDRDGQSTAERGDETASDFEVAAETAGKVPSETAGEVPDDVAAEVEIAAEVADQVSAEITDNAALGRDGEPDASPDVERSLEFDEVPLESASAGEFSVGASSTNEPLAADSTDDTSAADVSPTDDSPVEGPATGEELSIGTALDLLASGWRPAPHTFVSSTSMLGETLPVTASTGTATLERERPSAPERAEPRDVLDGLSDTLEFEPFELDEPQQQFASRRERRMADRSHGLKDKPASRTAVTANATQTLAVIGDSVAGAARTVRGHRFVVATGHALDTARRAVVRRFVRLKPSQRILASGVMVAIVAALVGIVAPVTIEKVVHANAHAAYAKAAKTLEAARAAYSDARAAWDARAERAAAEHEVFATIESTLPASLADPASAREGFVEASSSFTVAADLVPSDDGVAQAEPGFTLPRPAPVADPSVATDHLRADTRELLRLAGITSTEANRLTQATQRIDDAYDATVTSLDGLVTAAHSKGVTLSFEKASEETRLAFEKAVAALVAPIPGETSSGASDDDDDSETSAATSDSGDTGTAETAGVSVGTNETTGPTESTAVTSTAVEGAGMPTTAEAFLALLSEAQNSAQTAPTSTATAAAAAADDDVANVLQVTSERIAAYVDAHDAAKASHDEAVKAEKERKKEERERQKRDKRDSDRGDDGGDRGDRDDGDDRGDSDDGDRRHNSSSRGDVREGNGRCTGWGGSASAAWTDDISIPRGTSTWWIDDYSGGSTWTVYWICSNW